MIVCEVDDTEAAYADQVQDFEFIDLGADGQRIVIRLAATAKSADGAADAAIGRRSQVRAYFSDSDIEIPVVGDAVKRVILP